MLMPGDVVGGRYAVESLLAKGGMGNVYLVRDNKLNGKTWVLKEIEQANDGQALVDEAQILIELSHPYIPKMTDYFKSEGDERCYLVMEYIKGMTLQQLFEQNGNRLHSERIRKYFLQLCDILAYLHQQERPIVFRDLKPANIMVDEQDNIRLIDFGIARTYGANKLTDTVQMGTVAFAAPEQFANRQTDPRTDIYAMGTLLYYIVTGGQFYFQHAGLEQWADLPVEWKRILQRLLQPNPNDRFQNIAEVRQELLAIASVPAEEQAVLSSAQQAKHDEQLEPSKHVQHARQAQHEAVLPIMPFHKEIESANTDFERTSPIFASVFQPFSQSTQYTVKATQANPALIIYLLDTSGSMELNLGDKTRLEVVTESLYVALKQMVFRSTKGSRISSRYRVAIYAYSDEVHDLLGGIKSIDELMQTGRLPTLETGRFTNTAQAFLQVEQLLKQELPRIQDCPAPLICHMTDGVYTGEDPEPIAKRLMDMSVQDGHVLVENIFIADQLLERDLDQVHKWPGIDDETVFVDPYGDKLRAMSSAIPESYRQMMMEANYSLNQGAYLMFPGTNAELVSLGFQMSAATPI